MDGHSLRAFVATPFRGLFVKFMGAFVVVVLMVGVLVPWIAGRVTREEFHLFVTSIGQHQAERVAPVVAEYYQLYGSWDGVEEMLAFRPRDDRQMPDPMRPGMRPNSMTGWPGDFTMWQMMGTQVVIADADGEVVAGTVEELIGAQIDHDSLSAGAAVVLGDEQIGTVMVAVGAFSETNNDLFLQQVSRATWWAALAAVAVGLLLGGVLAWGVTRPLRELKDATRAIAAGDLTHRVDIVSGDEVGDLALAFNQMAAELERAESLRRQMTADIAHELRTPLSVIQGNVEALQDGVFPLTAEALEPIQAKTALLSRLVEDLRNLALAEAGQLPLDRQPTDLKALTERTLAAFQAGAEEKGIALKLAAEPELPRVDADPQRVEQVLVNLLSNALRHTPCEGQVMVDLSCDNGRELTVRVTDTGAGISAEDLPNVFERFYRMDKGRVRSVDGDGTGIGLAVTRSIVAAHGGSIGVDSPPGKGASFWFKLPVAL